MILTGQIAKQIREVYFGGNWTDSCLKDHLTGVDWKLATTKIHSLNTIAALVYHINYYVLVVTRVLKGEALHGQDKYSFDHPPVLSDLEWKGILDRTWKDAEVFATLVEKMPAHKLWEVFGDEKYGDYYRNLLGVIEHTHYHLGQIVLIKKIIGLQNKN